MADIFISYARPDREIARHLAETLTARGYQVWWDYELLGGEEFRDAILDELHAAKAVIVIWSANSAKSAFVRDEASRAQSQKKLVATCADGFDTSTLPLGFGGLHCHPVSDIDKTIKAVEKLYALPAASKTAIERGHLLAEEAFWSAIENSKNPRDFEIYLEEYPSGVHRALARLRHSKLKDSSYNFESPRPKAQVWPSRAAIVIIWLIVTSILTFFLYILATPATAIAILLIGVIYAVISIVFLDYLVRRNKGYS